MNVGRNHGSLYSQTKFARHCHNRQSPYLLFIILASVIHGLGLGLNI